MPKPIDTLGTRDENGTLHINRNTPGCPHCGIIDVKYDATGTIALWHPGAECCEPRIQQQITWRRAEITQLNYDLDKAKEALKIKTENREFKGDYEEATRTLERKTAEQIKPINDELNELGDKLRSARKLF